MAEDIRKIVADPDFMALPISEQVKGLAELDQDYGGLPTVEQVKGLKELRGNPSMFRNFVLGFGKGLSDPVQGLKQRVSEIGQALGVVSPETAQGIQDDITKRENTYKSLTMDSTAANIGQMAGDITSTAFIPGGIQGSILKRMGTAAIGGGIAGALQPTTEDESPLMNALKVGGISAFGTGMIGSGRKIRNAITGKISKPNEIVEGIRGITPMAKPLDLTRKDIIELSKKYSIDPTYGETTGSQFSKNMEIIGERFPWVFGLSQFRKKVAMAADDAANNSLMRYMADPNAPDTMLANRAFVSSLYEDMKKMVSRVPVQAIKPDETKAIASELYSRYKDPFSFSQDIRMKNLLSGIVGDTENKVVVSPVLNPKGQPITTVVQPTFTFDDMWKLRESIGDALGQAKQKIVTGDVNKNQVYQLSKLYGAVSKDMDNWADSIGAPAIKESFKAANDAYRHYVVKYDLLQRAYDNASGVAGKGDREFFSPQVFSRELKKLVYMDKELKRFTSNELTEMAGLANIMQVVKRSGQYAAGYNTGIQALTIGAPLSIGATVGAMAGGGLAGGIVGAGAVASGAGMLRFLTTTKTGKSLLMASSHIDPQSYTMKMLINTIERQAPRGLGFYQSQGGTQ